MTSKAPKNATRERIFTIIQVLTLPWEAQGTTLPEAPSHSYEELKHRLTIIRNPDFRSREALRHPVRLGVIGLWAKIHELRSTS